MKSGMGTVTVEDGLSAIEANMNFKLPEQQTDIVTLIKALAEIEQNSRKTLEPGARACIQSAAHILNECRSVMEHAATELEQAAELRSGFMDSDSRKADVSRSKNIVMEEQARFMRSLLNQRTPSSDPSPKKAEVI